MTFTAAPIWKEAPFIRFIVPFIAGIVVKWYVRVSLMEIFILGCLSLLILSFMSLPKAATQFSLRLLNGAALNTMLFTTGMWITHYRAITVDPSWIGLHLTANQLIYGVVEEELSEKERSYKAIIALKSITDGKKVIPVKGSVIAYFQKDTTLHLPGYGSQIIFKKELVRIQNTGNPGAFDYQRYCAFQDIYHQVFLRTGDYTIPSENKENRIKKVLFSLRKATLAAFHRYIPGNKESGLAEALLIGYKDDLDKDLVLSYSHTGVVHIIAISGMQLALIYGLLSVVFRPFKNIRMIKWLKPLVVIIVLWLFSLMSGASPSVIRAAVMFTCIVVGERFSKRISIYNNLAASAFLLLCYDPFWLWDTGFQLSYGAVLSIVIFMKPIYNLLILQNKLLDLAWELASVSIAAQVLTTPMSIYYFHQFPNYFLLTNMVAVPLSTIVLFGELLLLGLLFFPFLAHIVGSALSWLIRLMNNSIGYFEHLPFSLWTDLSLSIAQVFLLYIFISGLSIGLMLKKKWSLNAALFAMLSFSIIRSISFWNANRQEKMIIYNVPRRQAIDFILGRKYVFKGNLSLPADASVEQFYLAPCRIMLRLSPANSILSLTHGNILFYFGTKRVLIIDQSVSILKPPSQIKVDVIVLSKNSQVHIQSLAASFDCKLWIFDSSNTPFKMKLWKSECAELGLSCYAVVDKGAFVMNAD